MITSTVDRTGTLLATGGADGSVKVWDIRGGYTTHTFRGHGGIVSALHFFETESSDLPNGSHKKSAPPERREARAKKGKASKKRETAGRAGGQGFRLASGDEDGKIRIWDLQRRSCLSVLASHVSIVRGLDFNREENLLVSASRDKTVILWDARLWKSTRVIPVLEVIEAAGFTSGSRFVYTAGEQGTIRIWATKTGREATADQQSRSGGDSIVQLVCHPKLNFFLSVHSDQSLLLHSTEALTQDPAEGSLAPLPVIRRISGTHDEVIDLAYLLPDRSLLALATNSEDLRIVSVVGPSGDGERAKKGHQTDQYFGADVVSLRGHEDIIISVDTDWSGTWIATGAKDNTARLWRANPAGRFTCMAVCSGHAESLGAVALPKIKPVKDSVPEIGAMDRPPPFLISGSQDLTIKCWDTLRSERKGGALSPQARYTRKAHDKDINALDINHDATLFASASQDRTVKLWSVEGGEAQGVLRGHRRGVWSVQFGPKNAPSIVGQAGSASGNRGVVLTGSGDKTIKIWNLSDYSCLRTLEGHTNSVLKVIWLPSLAADDAGGRQAPSRVASAGGDGLVKVWDAAGGEVVCTLDNHTDRVWALDVKPDTCTLVSGGGDGVITFWKDTTSKTAAAAQTAASQRVEQEQQLENLTHAKAYREAITLALQMNHPARLLALFTSVVHTSPPEEGSLSGVRAVDDVLASLANDQLYLLLLRVRDWNTNARTAPVAQQILWVLVKSYPAARFVELSKSWRRPGSGSGGDSAGHMDTTASRFAAKGAHPANLLDLFDALKAYTQRHYERVDDLVDESYVIEYTLREMDQVGVNAGEVDDDGHRIKHHVESLSRPRALPLGDSGHQHGKQTATEKMSLDEFISAQQTVPERHKVEGGDVIMHGAS